MVGPLYLVVIYEYCLCPSAPIWGWHNIGGTNARTQESGFVMLLCLQVRSDRSLPISVYFHNNRRARSRHVSSLAVLVLPCMMMSRSQRASAQAGPLLPWDGSAPSPPQSSGRRRPFLLSHAPPILRCDISDPGTAIDACYGAQQRLMHPNLGRSSCPIDIYKHYSQTHVQRPFNLFQGWQVAPTRTHCVAKTLWLQVGIASLSLHR